MTIDHRLYSEFLSFPLSEHLPVELGVTTRDFPVFLRGTPDLSETKISSLSRSLPGSKKWIFAEQIHGSKVACVFEDSVKDAAFQRISGVDGLLTTVSGATLSILTADCLSIFFLVPDPLMIGVVHAGWRGSAGLIAQEAVGTFQKMSQQNPETFLVAFGPSIGPCCYEVGEELNAFFPDSILRRNGRCYLDLAGENRRQLEKAGLRAARINSRSSCTACHPELFYSYRREKEKAGRMVSWIRMNRVL